MLIDRLPENDVKYIYINNTKAGRRMKYEKKPNIHNPAFSADSFCDWVQKHMKCFIRENCRWDKPWSV